MKIFDSYSGWDSKVNFSDNNNLVVGYDTYQSCCEHADWFISKTEDNNIEGKEQPKDGLEEYVFDKQYFVSVEPARNEWGSCLDSGGMVRFKMIADGKPDLFLHIYNSHNGYYSHGFDFKEGKTIIQSGNI